MSWDNVKGVSSAKIWTDNPNLSQAYLFANGNHQVKVTVGLSLTLTNTSQGGPTADEVKAALSLIDYETGAALSHLKTGSKGSYSSVYLPNLPMANNAVTASSDIAYQYEFDYYLSSDSTINANYSSEKVALLLSYTNSSGTKVTYSTASGSKSQSSVAVTVYPPKRYGVTGSGSTPVIIKQKDDQPGITNSSTTNLSNETVSTYSLRIDDSYFRIVSYEYSGTPQSPIPFTRHATNISPKGPGYDPEWNIHEAFIPVENRVYHESSTYNSLLSITYNDSNWAFFSVTISIHQDPFEIIVVHFACDYLDRSQSTFSNKVGTASLTIFDQFGNKLNVVVSENDSGFNIDSVA